VARPICEFEGCSNLAAVHSGYKYKNDGKIYYKPLCSTHHKAKYGQMPSKYKWSKKRTEQYRNGTLLMSQEPCARCGWNESYCHRHKINPKIGYTKENVISLCPNCHQLLHLGSLVNRKVA